MNRKYFSQTFFASLAFVVFVLVVAFVPQETVHAPETPFEQNRSVVEDIGAQKTIRIGETLVRVDIADTNDARVRGLSGRNALPADSGMLFVFEKPQFVGIWMKDMNFPIDILWLDENFTIIDMQQNVSPQTFPEVFTPSKKSLYVLELPAGFVQLHSVKEGSVVVI